VVAKDPATPAAHYDLGLAYLARNEEAGYPKAIPEFRLQLKIDPDDFPSHYMLGYIALKQRNFDEAERELKRAAALNPGDRGAQLLLGQLYSETNRRPLAEEVLRNLIASSASQSPDNELVRAHYMLGRTLQQAGQAEDGTNEIMESERLRKSIRLSVAETSASRVRTAASASSQDVARGNSSGGSSRMRVDEKDRQQAEAFIHQISPAIAEGYYNLGGIADRHKDSATARQYLQKAIQWDPSLDHPKP